MYLCATNYQEEILRMRFWEASIKDITDLVQVIPEEPYPILILQPPVISEAVLCNDERQVSIFLL